MAVYTETLQLEDQASPAAQKAQRALEDLDKGLAIVNKTLVETETLAGDATLPLAGATIQLPAIAGPEVLPSNAPIIPEPEVPGVPAPAAPDTPGAPEVPTPAPPDPAASQGFEKLALSAELAAKVTEELQKKLEAAQFEMAKAAALGDQATYDGALISAIEYTEALGRLGPVKEEVSEPMPPLVLDASNMELAQNVANSLAAELQKVEEDMIRAQAAGDMEGFKTAVDRTLELQEQLSKLPEPAAKTESELSKMFADAAHAADVGSSTVGTAVDGIKGALSSLASGDAKGAVESVTESIAGMAKMLDMVVPGLGQLVATVLTIVGGLAAATVGLVQAGAAFAIEASQGKQASLAMWTALGQGVATGAEVDDMLSGLADRIGISKDKLGPLTTEFMKMGVTGVEALERLTLAAQSAEATVAGGGQAYTGLQKKIQLAAATSGTMKLDNKILKGLAGAGISVEDLAKRLGTTSDKLKDMQVDATKLGDAMTESVIDNGKKPLELLSNTVSSIKEKFMQDIGDMFEDIDVAPFMKEVKELFGIFSTAKPSGDALKSGIGGFFKEVFATATKVVPMVKHFLLDLVIYGLKGYIALKPIVKTIKEFFASNTGGAVLSFVLDAIVSAFKAIGVVVLVVVGLFSTMAVMTVAVGTAIWATIGALGTLAITIGTAVMGAISGAVAAFAGWVASAWQIGTDFINGLIQGITNGAAAIGQTVTGIADGAVNAFKGALGIASPSKVMMGLGGFTAEGFTAGLDEAAPDVHGAASNMASMVVSGAASAPAAAPAAAAATAASGGGGGAPSGAGGGMSVVFEEGAIQISGQGKDWSEVTEEMLSQVMERLAMQLGVA